jgi:hypothetical protein
MLLLMELLLEEHVDALVVLSELIVSMRVILQDPADL